MKIRYAIEGDAILLAALGRKTFQDTFASQNRPEDIALYLTKSFSTEKQTEEIKNPNVIFLIAEIENTQVGFVKLNQHNRVEKISGKNPIELERIYAVKDYIGKGVGAELMKRAIQEAKDRGFDCLWLGVWEENPRAIKFYEKWGFKKVGTHTFLLGTDLQNDFIMELGLSK